MSSDNPHIIDVTVGKGGGLVHNRILLEQVADIALGLQEAGVEYMEVSHGRGIGAKRAGYPALYSDLELLDAAKRAAPRLKLSAQLSPHAYSLFEVERVAEYCELLRFSVDLDDLQRALEHVEAIRKCGRKVAALLERCHRLRPEACLEASRRLRDSGVDLLYVCDNFSSMSEGDVRRYCETLRDAGLPMGFQGGNATGRGVGNCLAAHEAGAGWLDGSLLGLGECGGVTPLEQLVAAIQTLGKLQNIQIRGLCQTAQWHAWAALRRLPRARHLDLLLSKLQLDYYPAELLERIAAILETDLESFLQEVSSGRDGLVRLKEADLRAYLEKHRIDLDVVLHFIQTGEIPAAEAAQ